MRYTVQSVRQYGLWLRKRKLGACHVSEETIREFSREYSSPNWVRHGGQAGLYSLLNHLIQDGVVTYTAPLAEDGPLIRVEQGFRCFLRQDRALSIATAQSYCPIARLFMSERFESLPLDLSKLSVLDVQNFVSRHANKHSSKRVQLMLTSLRSFLRYLYLRRHITVDLADHVPKVASWRLSETPKWLESDDIERILSCCDKRSVRGQRNHAVLMLLARLGLRAGEVVSLKLDDIRWDAGEITVCGKGRERKRFPIPEDVGQSLALYLEKARPRCSSRHFFLKTRAPYHELSSSTSLSAIVRRAVDKAGLHPPCTGAHLFRHSLATSMLKKGATLNEIGQILHHKSPNTTAIYAKVDLGSLQTLAQPWPGARS